MIFNEREVLDELDLAFHLSPGKYFPKGQPKDTKSNFFFDLEQGYFQTAGSRIHLYADDTKWAIVFEKSGYQTHNFSAEIELNYIGNCIDYPIHHYEGYKSISNIANIPLIEEAEFKKIANTETENFELINDNVSEICVREMKVPFNNNYKDYEKLGIEIDDYENPNKLIDVSGFIRYLNETYPEVISAKENDTRKHIPKDLPKLMTIEAFHYISCYEQDSNPSQQETYQLLAKVLVNKDTSLWKPTLPSNNSWRNWESGTL